MNKYKYTYKYISSNINEVKEPFQTFSFFYEEIFTHTQKT